MAKEESMQMRGRSSRWSLCLFALLALVPARLALAQSTGTLSGTVTDAQGGVMPGAQIVVHNEATGVERTAVSDSSGQYQVASLPPGEYRLEVRLSGFQTSVVKAIHLEVAQTQVQNVRLAVGGLAEEVSVMGEAPVVESTTTSVGQVISQRTVQEIPLNGRHFVDLGLLIPGSVAPQQNGFLTAPLRGQGSFAFNTAGNREDTVNFMINGINLNDQVQNQITFQPSINTVSEFKVDNSTMSAEYGRSSGAVVNIATRSGTNDFHGEAFEFLRNQRFDARNFFNLDTQKQSPFKRNQFGANLGGPIAKNRTFFFVTYEGLRQRQQLDFNSGILSDEQRAGVTDPVVRNLLDMLPHANATGANGAPRFIGTGSANVDIDQFTGDVNHQFSEHDRLHGYYARQRDKRAEPNLQGNTIPGFGDTRTSTRQIGTLNETHIFGSNLVNEVRFGFNRINITFAPNVVENPASFGINNGINTAVVLPQITVQGVGLNFGGPNAFPQGRTDTTFVLSDTVSYLRGRHAFKFGGEYRRFHNLNFQTNGGTFTFPSLAAFQSGTGSAFTVTLGDIDSEVTQQAFGLFVQDNFKVRSNVTLELGLRYDVNASPTEADDRFIYFDPGTASLQRVGQGVRDKIYDNRGSWQPRVGVVWDPWKDGRTSIRAAYAMLTDQPVTNVVTPTAGNPPLVTPLSFTGAIRLDNALDVAQAAGLAPQSVNQDFRTPRVQTWNLNVQRELWHNFGLMVGYFGSKGDHLRVLRNINQFVNGARPFPRLAADSPILPNSGLGNISEVTSLGYSRYNGLWVTLNKRFSGGLQLNGSYTLSKSKDTNSVSSTANPVIQDSFNIPGDYALSDYDARHRYVLSAIWELPFKGNPFVEGWQLSLITQGQTGNPITIVTNIANFTGNANLRPDLIGSLDVLGQPEQWFSNTVCDPRVAGSCTADSVFALPVSADGVFHMGNLPRNAITGPGFYNTDLSLIKKTKIGGTTVELRAEAYNLFNHPNFGVPLASRTATVGSTSFGVLTSTRLPTGDSGSSRQFQFAMKVLF
jgi:hypothetical protein